MQTCFAGTMPSVTEDGVLGSGLDMGWRWEQSALGTCRQEAHYELEETIWGRKRGLNVTFLLRLTKDI